jgi:hypothetical protein
MTRNGLQFAPAVPGDEPAYIALQRALANYDSVMQTNVAERPEGPGK